MKIVTPEVIEELLARAATAPRRRMNLNFHPELSDRTHRQDNRGVR
jgi:hypothetical protein